MAKKVGKKREEKERVSATSIRRKRIYEYFRKIDTSRQADGDHSKLLLEFRTLATKGEKREKLLETANRILDHFRIDKERTYFLPLDHPLGGDPWAPGFAITETLANLLAAYLGEEELVDEDEDKFTDWPY